MVITFADISSSTESSEEQDSTGNSADPSSSLVNHYANVNSTFRHSQTWRRQQKSGAVAVAPPRAGSQQQQQQQHQQPPSSAGTLQQRHNMPSSRHHHTLGRNQASSNGPLSLPHSQSYHNTSLASAAAGNGNSNNVSTAPNGGGNRGYSSFTDSDHGDASSAVVSLNGTQIVMNNMARSRAPLPGFSSFV